jgi:hypothetical protein
VYGTIARMKVTRENLAKLRDQLAEIEQRQVAGFVASHVLEPDEWNDEVQLVVFFDDKESYVRNADDPAQHEDYMKFRAFLEADPEWLDGEWHTYTR